ncbi:tetratricopeptide repeat protein 36 isoform X1 [Salmo salar]|uniref:Tetratricopeptide repeat protein 36 n=1 Tax=Salmo salar TaxID=8030 RepID=A0ABM3DMV4_SALSA|nr:tetratricopeptide repeat protein 36 isoform X1 [Salmo salar]
MASAHDRAVLQAIFNPTCPSGDVPGLNQEEELIDDDSGFEVGLLQQVKDLEMEGVTAAEAGDLPTALERFSQAIDTLPQRASGYNNRAQTRRLQEDTEGALEDLELIFICGFCIPPGALEDLERAIALSGGVGRTACQALVQRGLLLRLACQDDKAREDFERAAVLGSEFARQQVVVLNPYAALCNRMLTEVINKLRNPEVSETQ